ncbi:MAG: hypothetical protein HZB43_08050 [candidate division Zixibacteria bacterium]|nr:hypothetical protein [candidate division Zixibacteria bacterium]
MTFISPRYSGPILRLGLSVLILALLAGNAFPQALPPPANESVDPWARVLTQVGMKPDDVAFDASDMSNYGGDEFVLPLFKTLHQHPFRIPYYADFHAGYLLSNWKNPSAVLGFCSQRINEGSRRGLIGDPLTVYRKYVEEFNPSDALDSLAIVADWRGWHSLSGDTLTNLLTLPGPTKCALTAIIFAAMDAYRWRKLTFAEAERHCSMDTMFHRAIRLNTEKDDSYDPAFYEFLHWPKWKYMYAGAQDLARAVRWAADTINAGKSSGDFHCNVQTPWGLIAIGGTANDNYPAGDYFIILELGGNDRYAAGAANRSYNNPVSMIIDDGGDDKYDAAGDSLLPSFGGGVLGYAYLFDRSGDDDYHGVKCTQGAGLFGVGLLMDDEGKDRYTAYMASQGSGTFGLGVLIDSTGNDHYDVYLSSQGYGFTKGMGLLLDLSGDDQYTSNDKDIRFPSAQSKEHNDAMSQGCGFGARRDFIDGYSLAGGIGYLIDGAGDDEYSAGLFAQGCAYWYGLGVLWDKAGNDKYNGIWYVQGSGAHFGVGYLDDKSGNDHYVATMNMAQGAGHDFTIGYLLDEAGDDVHDAPNLSLGGGNDNGIGLFWDKTGNDEYRVKEATTLGRANLTSRGSLRDSILTLGVFLDTGGKDTYPKEMPFARNDSSWVQRGLNTAVPLRLEKGCGRDW